MGFTFPNQGQDPSSVKREAVIIDISPNYMNNNSVIYCIGHSADYTLQINSSATLIIAGKRQRFIIFYIAPGTTTNSQTCIVIYPSRFFSQPRTAAVYVE